MDEIFLSEKNIANQTKKLILYLNLEKEQLTKDTVLKCKKIIENSMQSTFAKYGDRKPNNISLVEYIDKMNKKSLSDCVKVFDTKKEIKMGSESSTKSRPNSQLRESSQKSKSKNPNEYGLQPGKNQYMRPDEIMGNMKNPKHPEQIKSPSKEYQSWEGGGGYASFSNVDTASGPFITATGEYGLPIEMQNQSANQYPSSSSDGKKNFADDLQRKMDALRYEGGYGGGGMGAPGAQGMGNPMGNSMQMGNPMQMDMLQKLLPGVDMSTAMGQQGMGQQGMGQQGMGYNQNQFQNQNQNQNQQGSMNNGSNPMMQLAQLNQMMNQMQQSGQVNPQVMQQMMGQMQMLMAQMQGQQMQGQQMQGQQMQGQQYQQPQQQMQGQQYQQQMQGQQSQQPQQQGQAQAQSQGGLGFDYSFNSGGENMGNDFNAAYGTGGSGGYDGVDSLDGVYQHNSITGPVKNLSEQSGDLGGALEKMKAEREHINSNLGSIPKPTNFDPMQSPSQMNGNQSKQFNDFFF
jgi:hypothetical protein